MENISLVGESTEIPPGIDVSWVKERLQSLAVQLGGKLKALFSYGVDSDAKTEVQSLQKEVDAIAEGVYQKINQQLGSNGGGGMRTALRKRSFM